MFEVRLSSLFIWSLAAERRLGRLRWFCGYGSLGHGGLLLGLDCYARSSRLHSEGLMMSCFEVFGDNPECYALSAFQLAQSGRGHSGLPGRGKEIDSSGEKGPIDLKELVFHPAPPVGGMLDEYSASVGGFKNCCGTCGPARALSMVAPRNLGNEVAWGGDPSSCNEGCQRA